MDGHTLLPLPHWVCTVVALPRGMRPLGSAVHELLHGPLLAGGGTESQGVALALAPQGDAGATPYTRMRALLAVAEEHAYTGDVPAQVAALDELRVLIERMCGEANANDTGESSPPAGLTAREVEVLRHIAGGMTIKQVATELCLSPRTVERHITTIYRKIDARGRVDATAYAIRHALVSRPFPEG